MAKHQYATKPPNISTMPPGVPYIIGNEAAERFSFYGMRSILTVFMTAYLVNKMGQLSPMGDAEARAWFATFVSAVYFLPILGAILAEGFLGKYNTIFWLSIVYCLGHLALAFMDTAWGIGFGQEKVLAIGLGLIALGSGGIKPCVSANVGDQFGESNKHLLSKVFGWFYFSINAGSFISTILCPLMLANPNWGPRWAFGIPGVAMFIATIFFWAGRKKFVHIPPAGWGFVKQMFSKEGLGRARPAGHRLHFRRHLLVAVGPKLRRLLDAAGAEHGPEFLRDAVAARAGADGESDPDPALHPADELRHLSGDR